MTEGDRAGRWAVALLLLVGAAAYFTIFMVALWSLLVLLNKCFGVE
jgi:hypothetical protein